MGHGRILQNVGRLDNLFECLYQGGRVAKKTFFGNTQTTKSALLHSQFKVNSQHLSDKVNSKKSKKEIIILESYRIM